MSKKCCNNGSIVDVDCVYEDGRFFMRLPSRLPGLFTLRFTAPADYTAGDVVVVNGKELPVRTPGMVAASSDIFKAGAVIHCDIDMDRELAFFWQGGGDGGIATEVDPLYTADKPNLATRQELQDAIADLSDRLDNIAASISDNGTITAGEVNWSGIIPLAPQTDTLVFPDFVNDGATHFGQYVTVPADGFAYVRMMTNAQSAGRIYIEILQAGETGTPTLIDELYGTAYALHSSYFRVSAGDRIRIGNYAQASSAAYARASGSSIGRGLLFIPLKSA